MIRIVQNVGFLSRWLRDESLTRKASLNTLAAGLDYAARLVMGFVITPLLVAGLGDYLYGTWRILERFTGYISAASGRPTQALRWTIANRQASADYDEKRRQVGSAVAVWLLFLPILAALGGPLAWFAPAILDASAGLTWSVRLAAALLVIDLMMTSLADLPRSVLDGENQGYRVMGFTTLLIGVSGGLVVLALHLQTSIAGVAMANLASTLLSGVLLLTIVRRYVPWFGIARPSPGDVRKFFGLSGWFLGWRLVNQLMLASDIVLLGILNSPQMVTAYALTKHTPETLINVVAIMVSGVTPGLGGIIGAGNQQKAMRVRNEIMALTWLIATAVGAAVVLWNQSFLQLWVGGERYVGTLSNLLIMLMVTQLVLIRNDAFIIDLTLDLRRKVQLGALSAVLSLGIAGTLVGPFNLGILGLCLGFIAGRSILSLTYPWLVGRFFGLSLISQLRGALRPAFVTAMVLAVVLVASRFLAASTWIGLVGSVATTVVVVSSLAFFTGLSGSQRRQILQRARLVMRTL